MGIRGNIGLSAVLDLVMSGLEERNDGESESLENLEVAGPDGIWLSAVLKLVMGGLEERNGGESGNLEVVGRGNIWLSAVLELVTGGTERSPFLALPWHPPAPDSGTGRLEMRDRGNIWLSAVLELVTGGMERSPGSGSGCSGVGSRGNIWLSAVVEYEIGIEKGARSGLGVVSQGMCHSERAFSFRRRLTQQYSIANALSPFIYSVVALFNSFWIPCPQ